MIKIAVLMSTYNGEKYLKEQIDSILNQEGEFELHLIVRDDGSVDNTQTILDEYQKLGKLVWCKGENLRTARSFMDLLYNNRDYDFYAFSDQDDVWLKDKIRSGIERIENEIGPCFYFSNATYVDSNLESLGGNTYHRPLCCDFYSTIIYPCFLGCTMIFNKDLAEIVQKNQIPRIIQMHDSFLARVCVSVGGKIVYDNNVHILYRQHGDNVIGATVGKLDALRRRIRDIFVPQSITIDNQISELLRIYEKDICSDYRNWLYNLVKYKMSIVNRSRLICDNKPHYISFNVKLTVKVMILLGRL